MPASMMGAVDLNKFGAWIDFYRSTIRPAVRLTDVHPSTHSPRPPSTTTNSPTPPSTTPTPPHIPKKPKGSRGILREGDFHRKKRDFEVWLQEVVGLPEIPRNRHEALRHFRQYCEVGRWVCGCRWLAWITDEWVGPSHSMRLINVLINHPCKPQDYNTATFPHEKYYDVEKFEMDEYQVRAVLLFVGLVGVVHPCMYACAHVPEQSCGSLL